VVTLLQVALAATVPFEAKPFFVSGIVVARVKIHIAALRE
jgi:hypothetical protein